MLFQYCAHTTHENIYKPLLLRITLSSPPELSIPFQPPMLWSTRQVPCSPPVCEQGEDVVLRLQPGKRVSGVCYFCCPIASTWVPQGRVFIMLPRQVVRSYGEGLEEGEGDGVGWWSMLHHHGDSVSTASVNRPPGSVKNRTLRCPRGLIGS